MEIRGQSKIERKRDSILFLYFYLFPPLVHVALARDAGCDY